MKQLRFLLLPLLLIGWQVRADRCCVEQDFKVSVGPTFNYAQYKADDATSKIQGYLAGIHTHFEYQRDKKFHAEIQFDGRWNAGLVCDSNNRRFRIKDYRPELYLGYRFNFCGTGFYVGPFTGLGFYYLSARQPNVEKNRYYNLFVPVGLDMRWLNCEEDFEVGLRVLYRADVYNRLRRNDPDMAMKFKMRRNHGVHVEAPLTWYKEHSCTVDWMMRVVPFFDWNKFGAAKEVNNIPSLYRWHLGTRLEFGIRF